MRRRGRGFVALLALWSGAACSTIELAYDIPCRRGSSREVLRLWVVPDWGLSYWGTYMLLGDLLLPIIDVGVSLYWTVADLSNEHVRSRGGPLLAPVCDLASVVLPCVSSHREPIDLGRALFGMAWIGFDSDERERAVREELVLPSGATVREAKDYFVHRIARTAAEVEIAAARIVGVEWVQCPSVR
jgi:hypothetical protein